MPWAAAPGDPARALNVVLVDTGAFEYGLVVEELHDTVEIVVKPLGRHLKGLPDYAGATILGDGRVAVILDVAGLAARASLTAGRGAKPFPASQADEERRRGRTARAAPVPQCARRRPAPCPSSRCRASSGCAPRRSSTWAAAAPCSIAAPACRWLRLHDTAAVGELSAEQQWVVIVFERMGRPLGLLAAEPLDMVEAALAHRHRHAAAAGHRRIGGAQGPHHPAAGHFRTGRRGAAGGGSAGRSGSASGMRRNGKPTVLVADDSDFFRGQIQRLVEAVGCRVLAAEDGQAAWELLDRHAGEVDLVATDIEMPRLDGLALTRQIRADGRFAGSAGDRALLARGRGRDRPRHGCRRRRVSDQAQQGRADGEHPQGGAEEGRMSCRGSVLIQPGRRRPRTWQPRFWTWMGQRAR